MVSSRFLPFQEARQYARNLGLKNSSDWRQWTKSGARPQYIPARPEITYGKAFKGHPDFLGTPSYGPRHMKNVPANAESSCRRVVVRKAGVDEFLDHFNTFAKDFELQPFHQDSFITFLMRPHDVSQRKGENWAPLHIRMTKMKPDDKFCGFTHLSQVSHSFGFFGFEISNRRIYLFPSNPVLTETIKIRKDGKYDGYEIKAENLKKELLDYYRKHGVYTSMEWMECSFMNFRDTIWVRSMCELWKLFYASLDISVRFASVSDSRGTNVFLNNVPTLHRCAYIDSKGCLVVSLFRKIDGETVPFSAASGFTHLVVLVPGEGDGLRGLFIFPKNVCVEKGFLRDLDRNIPGLHSITLYQSEKADENTRLGRRHMWQTDYFVDLMNAAQAKAQFLKLFPQLEM